MNRNTIIGISIGIVVVGGGAVALIGANHRPIVAVPPATHSHSTAPPPTGAPTSAPSASTPVPGKTVAALPQKPLFGVPVADGIQWGLLSKGTLTVVENRAGSTKLTTVASYSNPIPSSGPINDAVATASGIYLRVGQRIVFLSPQGTTAAWTVPTGWKVSAMVPNQQNLWISAFSATHRQTTLFSASPGKAGLNNLLVQASTTPGAYAPAPGGQVFAVLSNPGPNGPEGFWATFTLAAQRIQGQGSITGLGRIVPPGDQPVALIALTTSAGLGGTPKPTNRLQTVDLTNGNSRIKTLGGASATVQGLYNRGDGGGLALVRTGQSAQVVAWTPDGKTHALVKIDPAQTRVWAGAHQVWMLTGQTVSSVSW